MRGNPAIIIVSFIICTLSFQYSFAQQKFNYDKEWKNVDSLIIKKGLPTSALVRVNNIYASAKKERNDAQMIKALIYRIDLQGASEEAEIKYIRDLEKEITGSNQPIRSILNSILATQYWLYLAAHRNQLYDRTETVNFKKEDIATWDIDDLHKKISSLFLESISNEKLLQQTNLNAYDPIIIKGNVRYLRPTLFDLLSHKALEYFKNDEPYIKKPSYSFEISGDEGFAEAKVFASHRFITNDTLSLQHRALQLFQQLISFHLSDKDPGALIDVDLERLRFVQSNSISENKDSLFERGLERLANSYPNAKETDDVWYEIAHIHELAAMEYAPLKDTAHHFDFVIAKNICESIIRKNQLTEGKSNCESLLQRILYKMLFLQTEKVNVPGLPFRTLIKYRNVSEIFFRLSKIDKATKESFGDTWQDEYWNRILQLPVTKAWAQSLPAMNDYQTHNVEIKIDALPVGEYILVATDNKEFSPTSNILTTQYFHVSNLAYINNGKDFFILNRQDGNPLENVGIQVWEKKYNYQSRKYEYVKEEALTSGKNGYVTINSSLGRQPVSSSLQLELTTKDDHLYVDDNIFSRPYETSSSDDVSQKDYEKNNRRTFYFTDRAIYRPGQTVYFKAIIITKDFNSRRSKIVPNFKTKVFLYDADWEAVDSLQLTSNEFGSLNGKFKIPENRLSGEFSIVDENEAAQAFISVEEYKRPKFRVDFEKEKGIYRLYDTILATGQVKAFAGNLVGNASVKYRVVRETRFPYPWLFKGIWPTRMEEQEIAHGDIRTDDAGRFVVRFNAIPDKKIKKEYKPIFHYRVIADVTDINGETRSSETEISVSYQALQLSILISESIPTDSLKEIGVRTTNLAGEFQPAKINVSIWKLEAPNRLIRERYWEQPDQFLMTKDEYLKYFPFDEYSNEANKESWQRLQKSYERNDSSKSDSKFSINNVKLLPGWYTIEVTSTDKDGDSLKDARFVHLIDSRTGDPGTPSYSWVQTHFETKEPGETASVQVGTSSQNVFVIQQKQGIAEEGKYDFFQLSNELKRFPIPITESDRGGFAVSFVFVKHNRFYVASNSIVVPWTNKDLNISYESYRDKSLPGAEEKWKIKLAGFKNDKIGAEVLASMYDASLDEFKPQMWEKPSIWPTFTNANSWQGLYSFTDVRSTSKSFAGKNIIPYSKSYDQLMPIHPVSQRMIILRSANGRPRAVPIQDVQMNAPKYMKIASEGEQSISLQGKAPGLDVQDATSKPIPGQTEYGDITEKKIDIPLQIRKNFNETAFFFPELRTDTAGNIEFSFTMPEALTQWKWMTLAHTKDLAFGYSEKNIVTQKELMLQPNLPRFFREGDVMEISAKIVNLADSEVTGQVQLQLIDATTNESVDGWFQNMYSNQYFTAPAKGSVPAQFSVQIPHLYSKPVIVRLIARAGNVSDGEENVLPVLTNKVLVTETLPLNVRGTGTKEFKLDKLVKSGGSETLQHHALTVEFTSNPAWYAVQALPYLMEFPYECAEQVWNRFYANALGTKIVNASPKIKEVFEKWKITDTAALLSNLQKNQELKSVLLQETPWVMEAKNETEQKKRVAVLFDAVRMSNELEKNLDQLMQMQSENGGFVWFKGGPDDRYITQYILTGIGHLNILKAVPANLKNKIDDVAKSGINYLDARVKEDYDRLVKSKADLTKQQISYSEIQYLYMRSFFNSIAVPGTAFQAYNYYRKQSQQFWVQQNRYMQGMIALALFRTGDGKTPFDILRSLKQNAIVNQEMGMYWKDIRAGYYWHQAPIETQALLIEAFATIYKDNKVVDDLKTWLLKNKQTNKWNTTKATAEACYALLLQGTDWLVNAPLIHIRLGDKQVSSTEQAEAGTGYFKKTFDGPFVNPTMGNITVAVNSPSNKPSAPSTSTSWGAVYWQYFENSENITSSATPLNLVKKLFVERNTDRGPVIEPIGDKATLKVGDKVKVRIELRVDRDMEYVHMKDMRAAAFEPVNVISSYKWQGGLGYYESTKDASTNFFFNYLPKGTYVFEYPLFATQAGTFSNGITSIQCMYAPEFSSHSEGIKVTVESSDLSPSN